MINWRLEVEISFKNDIGKIFGKPSCVGQYDTHDLYVRKGHLPPWTTCSNLCATYLCIALLHSGKI